MKTREELLKELIVDRYKTLREFSYDINLAPTTVQNIFSRGLDKTSRSTLLYICEKLKINAGDLLKGKIVEIEPTQLIAEEAIDGIAGLTVAEKKVLTSLIGLFRERKNKE